MRLFASAFGFLAAASCVACARDSNASPLGPLSPQFTAQFRKLQPSILDNSHRSPAVFSVTDYGAKGDNSTDNTQSFRNASAAAGSAATNSTPTVLQVPAGVFLTGAFNLSSFVTLQLSGDRSFLLAHHIVLVLPFLMPILSCQQ